MGSIFTLAPGAFVNAVEQLTSEAPDTESTAELISAWTLLSATTLRGAEAHHRWFHRCFDDTGCNFRSAPPPPVGSFAREHVRPLLMTWAGTYMDRFRDRHVWPVAIRAAPLMQARADADWYIDELASAVNTSTPTLERSFNRIYGISPQPYHSLLRLRLIASEVRAGESAIEGVLLELGWRSPKDAYRAFRKVTGITPAAVRRLSDVEFATLRADGWRSRFRDQSVQRDWRSRSSATLEIGELRERQGQRPSTDARSPPAPSARSGRGDRYCSTCSSATLQANLLSSS